MKRFFADITIVFGIFILINVLVRVVWVYYVPNHCVKTFDEKIHTIVVGSSMTECSINDSILDTYLNLSESGLFYCANYNSVIWANEYTNLHVDTVICCVGMSSFFHFEEGCKLDSDAGWIHRTERYSLIDYSSYLKNFISKKGCIDALLEPLVFYDFRMSRLGGSYLYLDRFNLRSTHSSDELKLIMSKYGKNGYSESVIKQNAKTQVAFLVKIQQYCNVNKIVLVLMNTPTYHFEEFIDDDGYRQFIKNTFGEDQLVADYTDFELPYDSCWGDRVHLNYRGAEYFSNYIKEHGLELITAKEYCERKKQK